MNTIGHSSLAERRFANLVVSAVMGLICIALIVALYAFSGGWKAYGGITGIWKWLKQGGLSSPPSFAVQNGGDRSDATGVAEVADILDDIYREFMGKLDEQSKTIHNHFEASVTELRGAIQGLEERVNMIEMKQRVLPAETVVKAPEVDAVDVQSVVAKVVSSDDERHSFLAEEEPVYFRILDAIRRGELPDDIANKLGVTVHDVDMVRQIMETPFLNRLN